MPESITQTHQYVLDRLINATNAAEGSLLPPKFRAGKRIPTVKNLRLLNTEVFSGETQFTLVWDEPDDPPTIVNSISHYNIYVSGITGEGNLLSNLSPWITDGSPAVITFVTEEPQRVTFTVQTILKNGQSSELSFSPSVTGISGSSQIQESDLAFGLNSAYAIQPINAAINDNLNTVHDTTIISETASGVLLSFGALYGTVPTGNPVAGFKITVDGAAEQFVKFWDAANVWSNALKTSCVYSELAGSVFAAAFQLGIVYNTSIVVKWSVTTASSNSVNVDLSALRALKVT